MLSKLIKLFRPEAAAVDVSTARLPAHSLELSPVKGDKKVVVFTGWAGAGKTNLLKQLVNGLVTQLKDVSGIVNEQGNSGSVNVDLSRLPAGFDKLGMGGCICCAGIQQVKEALSHFHLSGKKVTLLEQSPLSDTANLRKAIKKHGFDPYVIAVLKPGQVVPRYSAEQIRSADAIVVSGPFDRKTRNLIEELTSDLSQKPEIIEFNGADRPFPPDLWEGIQKGSLLKASSEISSKSEADRRLDVENFTEIVIEPYSPAEGESVTDWANKLALSFAELTASNGAKVDVLRVKGVVAGHDIDLVSLDGKLKVSAKKRTLENSDAYGGRDYLFVRSLTPRLKDCWNSLFKQIGTANCSQQAVKAVTDLYPSKEKMLEQLADGGRINGVFESDTMIWDIGDTLEFVGSIASKERRQEITSAVVSLTREFLKARISILEVLGTEKARSLHDYHNILFDTLFFGTRILAHSQISRLFAANLPFKDLQQMSENLWQQKPVVKMLESLSVVNDLRINGANEITLNDIEWLKLFVRIEAGKLQHDQKLEFSELCERAFKNISERAEHADNRTWIAFRDRIRESLTLND